MGVEQSAPVPGAALRSSGAAGRILLFIRTANDLSAVRIYYNEFSEAQQFFIAILA
jgi:hypothetical protein